ncbi:hypothetical protein F5883DRAFT_700582 [Diaporthe sp. PMI_573]|nr:hypothetical protein F5883DRAFT_700582 [Diaporthaceae sp. PMI_573]
MTRTRAQARADPSSLQDTTSLSQDSRTSKCRRVSVCSHESAQEETADGLYAVAHWASETGWPQEYFAQAPSMQHFLARKKSSSSLTRKRAGSGSATSRMPSDQKPREEKIAPYRDPRYKILLATKGSFMDKSDLGITITSKSTVNKLLEATQAYPRDSLFRDDIFETTCRKVADRNEARIIRDITPLIAGTTLFHLLCTPPQPDYSVGFRREAFTAAQLEKLSPFIGDFLGADQSFFMATYLIYFPFLTCEVKCGAAPLEIADRQNAHSGTLAAQAIVELFRLVKREVEVNRQILSFTISHDHRFVRIYGHYPIIDGEDIEFYRHPTHEFSFAALDGKQKWTAYSFTKNVYELWMPTHLKTFFGY